MRKAIRPLRYFLTAAALLAALAACDDSAGLEDDEDELEPAPPSPKEEIVGPYTLFSVDEVRLPPDTTFVVEAFADSLALFSGNLTFDDTTAFTWEVRTFPTDPPHPGPRDPVNVTRTGEWDLLTGDTVVLRFHDDAVDTASFVDRSGTVPLVTVYSFDVPWVYHLILNK